jgi:hypothetical protein
MPRRLLCTRLVLRIARRRSELLVPSRKRLHRGRIQVVSPIIALEKVLRELARLGAVLARERVQRDLRPPLRPCLNDRRPWHGGLSKLAPFEVLVQLEEQSGYFPVFDAA